MDLKEAGKQIQSNRHPWEIARADRLISIILEHCESNRPVEVLDIGCGDSWFAQKLFKFLPLGSRIDCVDNSFLPESIERFKPESAAIELYQHPQKGKRYDFVLLLDVLEHIEKDLEFLNETSSYLRSGGKILITVPSHQMLFSEHDKFLGHLRRYSRGGLLTLIRSSNLELIREGSLFASLMVLRIFMKLSETMYIPKQQGIGQWRGTPWQTRLFVKLLNADNRLLNILQKVGVSAPGLSVWCVSEKKV